jgi:methyl-accepting chemotaxis protein
MTDAVNDLSHAVIRMVRTSTPEVDRRGCQRYKADLPCRLTVDGQTYRVQLVDISDRGAGVSGAPGLAGQSGGVLEIDAVGFPIPVAVKLSEGDAVHLEFVLDSATAAKLQGVPERLARRHAA